MISPERKAAIDSITQKWAVMSGVCVLSVFFVFAYFGDPGRGQAAAVGGAAIALATRFFWDLRNRAWFWTTIVIVAVCHVPLICFISGPLKQLAYIALLPACLLDFAIICGLLRSIEKRSGARNAAERSGTASGGRGR